MTTRSQPMVSEPRKALRVYLHLKDRILSGTLASAARMPSEPDLAIEHGVSRVTIRGALERLAEEGLVERRPGSGTYVRAASRSGAIVADFSNVFTHLVEMGRRTDVRLISFGYASPTPAVAEALGLGPGEEVQRSVRVRIADGTPFSYLVTYVPKRIGISYSEADLRSTPLLELLERSGARVASARQTVGATQAGPEIAEALGTETGAALLSITRIVKDEAGAGVEYLYALYRPDLYELQLDLERTKRGSAMRWAAKSPVATGRPANATEPRNPKKTGTGKRKTTR
ncbi:GntR family transcriptional regulator [Jiella avicenniae]|uniref:GntR family transcriptional regulator n=1 Tax=Jiella avicenniae TaxID=2907202 RepID=A0A9X1P3A4_9HYPH|nr:GntR family transcriptional regulator [Jiella avicenniae]MCE7030630.1 GntR family transcriptional regulator [Jiella avicenniae]